MATDKVSSLSKTNRKRYVASVMDKTLKHAGCLKIWSVKMIGKVTTYLADICLFCYLGLTVLMGWRYGNFSIQILLISTCLYTFTQHRGQLFSDIIEWGMCPKKVANLRSVYCKQNILSSTESHLESQDTSSCSEYLAMATDKVQSLSKTNRKRYVATQTLCDHDLVRA